MSFMSDILTKNITIWNECAAVPFIEELRTGILPLKKFKEYIIQDSIYLKNYARIYGKMIYHSTVLKDIQVYYSALGFVTDRESAVRLYYLKQFGVTDDDIEHMEPFPENKRYIDFLLDTAERAGICEMLMSVLPCMLSYSYIFRKIAKIPGTVYSEYFSFIQDYAEDEYFESCKKLSAFADEKCKALPAEEREKLSSIFEKGSMLELDFWKMAYRDRR